MSTPLPIATLTAFANKNVEKSKANGEDSAMVPVRRCSSPSGVTPFGDDDERIVRFIRDGACPHRLYFCCTFLMRTLSFFLSFLLPPRCDPHDLLSSIALS